MEVLPLSPGNLIFMENLKQILAQNLSFLTSTRKKNILFVRNNLLLSATIAVDLFLGEEHFGLQKIQTLVKHIGHKFLQLIALLEDNGQKKPMHSFWELKNMNVSSLKNGKFLKLFLIDLIFKLYHCLWK